VEPSLPAGTKPNLPPYQTLYALIRNEEQGGAVEKYRAKSIFFDIKDESSTTAQIDSLVTTLGGKRFNRPNWGTTIFHDDEEANVQ
jgi:hypothetical protein